MSDRNLLQQVFSCIDNTTLTATDTDASVEAFCRHTLALRGEAYGPVAAVCVYPRFVAVAKRVLEGSGIRVASVAGAFPHGQLPLELKVAEVRYAVAQGADEVDMVLSRGLVLEGDADGVVREVQAMKKACQGRTLKVILETCELPSPPSWPRRRNWPSTAAPTSSRPPPARAPREPPSKRPKRCLTS